MTTRHPLDPDDPERSEATAGEIAEHIPPMSPSPRVARAMRDRLLARVRATREGAQNVTFVRPRQSEFRDLMRGVRVLELSTSNQAVLLEFAPGANLPMHRHQVDEECIVISGSARVDDTEVRAGDYHRAPANSRHASVRSDHGAMLFVRGTPIGSLLEVLRDLVTAWLPVDTAPHVTLRADDGQWASIARGVAHRVLHEHGSGRSLMVRLAPGARFQPMTLGCPTESIVIDGDAYFGDEHAAPGDYESFSPDDDAPEIWSDAGATVFVRTRDVPRPSDSAIKHP